MTTKHTPATPLPFKDGPLFQSARRPLFWTDTSKPGKHQRRLDGDGAGERGAFNEQDAAYLAHAANAYPKLVEALAAFLRAPSIGSGGPGSVTIEVQSFNRDAAVSLIRELGEGS